MQPRDLSTHLEYVPGRGAEEAARERGLDPSRVITLSSNENPLGASKAAVEAVRAHADRLHRYPKAAHVDLVDAIAARWDVAPRQVWVANGGDGAIDYLSRAMLEPGDRVLSPQPGFAYYGMSARYHHGDSRSYLLRREHDFVLSAEVILEAYTGERIVYVNSPHNPTGSSISVDDIARIAEATDPDTLVVVDEAYAAFSETPSACSLVEERDDVAVLRSFSKSHGLAGLRLGYAIVPIAWAEAFSRVNTPFAASELACRAGRAAIDDDNHVRRSVEMVENGRTILRDGLHAHTWPSAGNFVLVDVSDATEVSDALLDRGILVRDCTSFGLDRCIRITVAQEPVMQSVVSACNEVLDNG